MRAFIISFFVVIFISAISFQATYAQQKDIVLTRTAALSCHKTVE